MLANYNYHIAGFLKGIVFMNFTNQSTPAVHKNFILKLFTKDMKHYVFLTIHEIFLLKKLEYVNLWNISSQK